MLSDKEFLAFINDASSDCPAEKDIRAILDEELEKSEDEIDTDLIEICLDELSKIDAKKNTAVDGDASKRRKRPHLKKILIAAAVLSVLVIGIFSVSATFSDMKRFDGIIEFYNEYIRVRFDKTKDNTDNYGLLGSQLVEDLESNGITPVVFPGILLTDDYVLSEVTYEKFDAFSTAHIEFCNDKSKIKGYIYLQQYNDENLLPAIDFQGVEDLNKMEVNGIDVYMFKQHQSVSIAYQDGRTQYDIVLSDNVSIDTAAEIAKTVK